MPEKARLERGERAIARLTEQLDRLVGALNLYEHSKSITVSPVALAPLFGRIASENMEAAIEKGRRVAHLPDDGVGDEPSGASGRGSAQPSAQCTQVYGAGGRILIGCRRSGPDVRIDVYDTGIGIAPEHLPRIF